ncbi:hypothetical protein ThrDRAFT_03838 [Frankia casuarinae]|nr:hypothetical protein CcI6DRAFT_04318 [Frankia sp. CcI6]EYT90534.1 hypothetical protein ThrDRAFT_03838 [Frankia casuarinae]KFB02933.1 hypothetical protein ALLO2DRAFT_04322 [Frankia sp. Allo2]OAA19342.1 hypothetical protein AAY23_110820 [Frankia casuarinae]
MPEGSGAARPLVPPPDGHHRQPQNPPTAQGHTPSGGVERRRCPCTAEGTWGRATPARPTEDQLKPPACRGSTTTQPERRKADERPCARRIACPHGCMVLRPADRHRNDHASYPSVSSRLGWMKRNDTLCVRWGSCPWPPPSAAVPVLLAAESAPPPSGSRHAAQRSPQERRSALRAPQLHPHRPTVADHVRQRHDASRIEPNQLTTQPHASRTHRSSQQQHVKRLLVGSPRRRTHLDARRYPSGRHQRPPSREPRSGKVRNRRITAESPGLTRQ